MWITVNVTQSQFVTTLAMAVLVVTVTHVGEFIKHFHPNDDSKLQQLGLRTISIKNF